MKGEKKMSDDLEGRIARLEATVEAFVSTVRSQFDNTSEQFESLYKHIDGLRDAIQSRDRTPWANLIAAGALMLAIITMVAQGYIRDLQRMQDVQDLGIARLQAHTGDGHPQSVIDEFENEFEHIHNDDAMLKEWVRNHDTRELNLYHEYLKSRSTPTQVEIVRDREYEYQ